MDSLNSEDRTEDFGGLLNAAEPLRISIVFRDWLN